MECRKIQERLTAYLEGIVSPEVERLIKEHISSCHGCSRALEDLKRAGELIKGLPEIEPPPWFKEKVMARIKTEEEAKNSLFRKLFYPLHIKVPIEGLATVLVATVAFLVLRAAGPEMKTSQAPSKPQVAAKGETSRGAPQKALKTEANLPPLKQGAPVRPPSQGERIRAETAPPSAGHGTGTKEGPLPRGREGGRAEGVQEEVREEKEATPLSPLPAAPAIAPRQKDETAAGRETQRGAHQKALSSPVRGPSLAKKKTAPMGVTIHTGEVAKAVKEIENLLVQLGANSISRQSAEGAEVIVAELRTERLKDLLEQLKAVGEVKEKDAGAGRTEPAAGDIRIRIEISSTVHD